MTAQDWQRLSRYALWHERRETFEAVLTILTTHDPVGICVADNPHRETEYAPEANTILPRLTDASSLSDVRAVVHEEFRRWFDVDTTGLRCYDDIATEVWDLLRFPLH